MRDSKELLLLEALCESLGFNIEFDEGQVIPSGQILVPAKYTLTDIKEAFVNIPLKGEVWGSMVNYILAHQFDIEGDINDFGSLKPVLDFFSRNC